MGLGSGKTAEVGGLSSGSAAEVGWDVWKHYTEFYLFVQLIRVNEARPNEICFQM